MKTIILKIELWDFFYERCIYRVFLNKIIYSDEFKGIYSRCSNRIPNNITAYYNIIRSNEFANNLSEFLTDKFIELKDNTIRLEV